MSAALKILEADALLQAVAGQGYALLRGQALAARLGLSAAALDEFAASWERLETDRFMADGGLYRRRRHANFTARWGRPGHLRNPHRPHFQAVVHNSLNGGVERWFAPVEDQVAAGAPLQALLDLGRAVADARSPGHDWFVEMHQFRIEAAAHMPGYPTPEGVHHDGVDYVLISMIARTNLAGGETLITDDEQRELARFTLLDRLDTAFVEDARVMHGVTPVQPADPALPSCRDVLVLTWKQA
ncbi:2OG-Fe dioxygenase family protein [Siccirubricoccus sp. KC 17139]|uniref:2OG-Fe dioxygenase family protein n=1 Tax=Siccirubricoccus soli TaxID=2899147 RepID=A0ABT1DB51_9PROT|nr:2OG-Fe dioxygenase family protein [Siccirubricoccus soli]MCO6419166.1 2OG-Fe dioxygenase family protein [Siccirubricoccus soli]MCP2685301.1 2OG-Fe dioxygenase family protein [Siccirubricoccus soli]